LPFPNVVAESAATRPPGAWRQEVAYVGPEHLRDPPEEVDRRVGRGPLDAAELLDRDPDCFGGPLLCPAPLLTREPRIRGQPPSHSRCGAYAHREAMLGVDRQLKKNMRRSIILKEAGA
jgi:hypothetical protein